MATLITESENNALVRRSIAFAEANASSDADFVRLLRATYFTSHPLMRKQIAAMRRSGRRGPSRTRALASAPAPSIFDDPRYLANARVLALRVTQRLRVMGGTKVAGSTFPDCVAVGSARDWGCTGTLVARNVVVSAGHCASVATRVYFGNDVTKKGTIIGVKKAVRHPEYHKGNTNDILVLVLERNSTVKPRRIAPGNLIDRATDGRAVGFGSVDATGSFGYGIKREVDLPVASVACSGKTGGRTDVSVYGCDKNLEMVAGKPLLAKDSCNGDSGGPFYVPSGSTWLLAGATSRATDSARSNCGDGGIYVRLDRYRGWIEDVAKVKLP